MTKKLQAITVDRYHADNHIPDTGWIFVFAAEAGGRHKSGTAKIARTNFRAEYGCSAGMTQKAYAICFFSKHGELLDTSSIEASINQFVSHAKSNPSTKFFIPDLAKDSAIAPAQLAAWFALAPKNCTLPASWIPGNF